MNKSFPIENSLKFGFNKFLEHPITLILAALAMAAAHAIGVIIAWTIAGLLIVGLLSGTLLTGVAWPFVLIFLVSAVVLFFTPMLISIGVTRGFIRIVFDIYQTNTSAVSRVFSELSVKKSVQFLALLCVYIFIVAVGSILIIPGIIFLSRFFYAPFAMIDRNLGITQSLRTSWNITRGTTLINLLFIMIVALMNIVPLLGTIISILTCVYMYKELAQQDLKPHYIQKN